MWQQLLRFSRIFLTISFFSIILQVFGDNKSEPLTYWVSFEGINDDVVLADIKKGSRLYSLRKRPPASVKALRYRAESDIPELVKILQAHGYYEAHVDFLLEYHAQKIQVVLQINPGARYLLESYKIQFSPTAPYLLEQTDLLLVTKLQVQLGKPLSSAKLLKSEQQLLHLLSEHGCPFAYIVKRHLLADGGSKTVRATLEVDTGSMALFGELCITGNQSVEDLFIKKKLAWKEGALYNSGDVERTEKLLMGTGLFSSILITHAEKTDWLGRVPMRLEVHETKHKDLQFGLSYQTVFGPGASVAISHRNISGMGKTFTIQGELTQHSHTGSASYISPDFIIDNQSLCLSGTAASENLYAYSSQAYGALAQLENRSKKEKRLSCSLSAEKISLKHSAVDGRFLFFSAPLWLQYFGADDLLDPQHGQNFDLLLIPSLTMPSNHSATLALEIQTRFAFFRSLSSFLVLAQQWTAGLLFASHPDAIPIPKKFLGGSEENLRGFRYHTVSPCNEEQKPYGGTQAFYYTLELRARLSESLGLVSFYDLGSVDKSRSFPAHWYNSAGLGIRYYSFVGPFRIDIAFPLNPRPHIDPFYKILVSIGQTF